MTLLRTNCVMNDESMPVPDLDSAGLERLGRDQCFELLMTVPIGRVVYTEGALPAIQPVIFVLDDEGVVFRTSAGSTLATAARRAIVAFEADSYDAETRTGWSVVLVGRADTVSDDTELRRLRGLRLRPWAGGERNLYIRIEPQIVRGRRIVVWSAR